MQMYVKIQHVIPAKEMNLAINANALSYAISANAACQLTNQ